MEFFRWRLHLVDRGWLMGAVFKRRRAVVSDQSALGRREPVSVIIQRRGLYGSETAQTSVSIATSAAAPMTGSATAAGSIMAGTMAVRPSFARRPTGGAALTAAVQTGRVAVAERKWAKT